MINIKVKINASITPLNELLSKINDAKNLISEIEINPLISNDILKIELSKFKNSINEYEEEYKKIKKQLDDLKALYDKEFLNFEAEKNNLKDEVDEAKLAKKIKKYFGVIKKMDNIQKTQKYLILKKRFENVDYNEKIIEIEKFISWIQKELTELKLEQEKIVNQIIEMINNKTSNLKNKVVETNYNSSDSLTELESKATKAKDEIDNWDKFVNTILEELNLIDSIKLKIEQTKRTEYKQLENNLNKLKEESEKIKDKIDSSINNANKKIEENDKFLNSFENDVNKIEKILTEFKEIENLLKNIELTVEKNKYKTEEFNILKNSLKSNNEKFKKLILKEIEKYKLYLNTQNELPSRITKNDSRFILAKIDNKNDLINSSLYKLEVLNVYANDNELKLFVEYKISFVKHPEFNLDNQKSIIENEGNTLAKYITWNFESILLKDFQEHDVEAIFNDLKNYKDNAFEALNKYFKFNNKNREIYDDEIIKLSDLIFDKEKFIIEFKLSIEKKLANSSDFSESYEIVNNVKHETIKINYLELIKPKIEEKLNSFKNYSLNIDEKLKEIMPSKFGKIHLNELKLSQELPQEFEFKIIDHSPNDLTGVLSVKFEIKHKKYDLKSEFEVKINDFKKDEIEGSKYDIRLSLEMKYEPEMGYNLYHTGKLAFVARAIKRKNEEDLNRLLSMAFKVVNIETNEIMEDGFKLFDFSKANYEHGYSKQFYMYYEPKATIIGKNGDNYIYKRHDDKEKNITIRLERFYEVFTLVNDISLMYKIYNYTKNSTLASKLEKEYYEAIKDFTRAPKLIFFNDLSLYSVLNNFVEKQYNKFLPWIDNLVKNVYKEKWEDGERARKTADLLYFVHRTFNYNYEVYFFGYRKFGKWLRDIGFGDGVPSSEKSKYNYWLKQDWHWKPRRYR